MKEQVREQLIKGIREEKDLIQIAQENGHNYSSFANSCRRVQMEIRYRHTELQKEVNQYLKRNSLHHLASELGMTHTNMYLINRTGKASYRTIIKLLNYFAVNYEIELIDKDVKKWREYPIKFPTNVNYVKKEEPKDEVSVKLYSHLLTQFNRKLQMLMNEKGIGTVTQSRINSIMTDMVKEAIQIGIHAERNKTEQDILDEIFKSIREDKIIEYRRESL
jgi:hypothetical protein